MKTIMINDKLWKKLWTIKIEQDLVKLENVIEYLIEGKRRKNINE